MNPLISCIMPVWNGERYLREAIDSILNQTLQDFELIILDDGSTDSTPSILAEYQSMDERIRVISLEHEGIVAALNRGIEEAGSNLIARMDSDDVAEPERFETQFRALSVHPSAVLCHTAARYIDGNVLSNRTWHTTTGTALIKIRLCFHSPIIHPTVMFRKESFESAGRYDPAERHGEDYGLWGRMIQNGDFIGINRPLLRYRIHNQSISRSLHSYQCELGRKIALENCRRLLGFDQEQAERAYAALTNPEVSLHEWFWLTGKFMTTMEYDFETVVWWIRRFSSNTLHHFFGFHRGVNS